MVRYNHLNFKFSFPKIVEKDAFVCITFKNFNNMRMVAGDIILIFCVEQFTYFFLITTHNVLTS